MGGGEGGGDRVDYADSNELEQIELFLSLSSIISHHFIVLPFKRLVSRDMF